MSSVTGDWPDDFAATLDFHGHLCLDIAMGYRVTKAALRALGPEAADPKRLVASVGGDTCAVDAVQALSCCTFGKRNLVPLHTGKPVYIWQNAATGNGVRIYVHYWETFDADGTFRSTQRHFKDGELSPDEAAAFEAEHEQLIRLILNGPEADLFRLSRISQPPPPRSGGFAASPCGVCGEYVKEGLLMDGRCTECAGPAG
ncbi:MAG: FmdE family protein [Leptospirillia bacterium]